MGLIMSVLPTQAAGPLQVPVWQTLVTSFKAQTSTSYQASYSSESSLEIRPSLGPSVRKLDHTAGWTSEALAVGVALPGDTREEYCGPQASAIHPPGNFPAKGLFP